MVTDPIDGPTGPYLSNEIFTILITGATVGATIGTVTITYQYEGQPDNDALAYISVEYPPPGSRT